MSPRLRSRMICLCVASLASVTARAQEPTVWTPSVPVEPGGGNGGSHTFGGAAPVAREQEAVALPMATGTIRYVYTGGFWHHRDPSGLLRPATPSVAREIEERRRLAWLARHPHGYPVPHPAGGLPNAVPGPIVAAGQHSVTPRVLAPPPIPRHVSAVPHGPDPLAHREKPR